ncbi:unnamed protein product [Paramecium sonneborni]|uniref:EF-hand domain-containing protein n=1 Tax=Paramecium sonneborni TaxID=65129 RepID=A0A8S1R2I9_9CILI|nr:unnamed protein product [Paramecium sonneborni]
MEDQVKRLQNLVEHLYRKNKINNSKLDSECYEVFSECVLIVQKEISVEIGNVMDKLFILMREMFESAQSQIKPHPQPKPILLTPQIPDFINALQLGSVAIFDQLGTPQQIKNYQQIPWCDYKCKGQATRNLRTYHDVGTSTIIDYYQNCQKASSDLLQKEEEMREWLEYTNDTITMLSEALANKKQLDIEFQGKPEELDLVISDIQFRRLNLESILKQVNLETFGVQNYDHTVQFLLSHIHHIQQQTAIAIIHRYKQKHQEKEKQQQMMNDMKAKLKKKTHNNKEDCRCSQYVNEIMILKNKLESALNEISKKDNQLLELQVINEQKDMQYRMMHTQLQQLESEKSEFKQKLDNIVREYSKFVKKNSDRERGYVSSSSNDEILINAVSGNPRTTSRDQSQQQSSKQQIYLTSKDNFNIQKKTQQMERLVKLVNALDGNNQTRRLTQMQFILEQKASSQIHELADLIKEIEENDLLQNDNLENSQISNNIDPQSSMRNLDYKLKQSNISRNLHQSSFEIETSNDKPAIKVSVPTEQFSYQQQITSSRNMSSASSNQKKLDSFGQLTNKMDVLKIVNTSPNQLTPHYPLSKAKSSQNINMNRQSSIKSEKKQQNIKQNDVKDRKETKEQSVQTDIGMTSNLFQTEKQNSLLQENEQIENVKFKGSNSKNNSQQQLTTSSTFNFNSAGTVGIGNLNSPIQSNTNSNLPSPRNQQSIHQTNVFPSPQSSIHKSKIQIVKREQEQNSQQQQDEKNQAKRKSLKQKIYEQQEEKHLNLQHRRMYTTTGTQSQNISPREYYTPRNKTKDDLVLNKLQLEYDDKQEEEKLIFDQITNEIPELNEQDIIQKAINRTPGYELGQEINDKVLETMFGNLSKTPEIVDRIIQLNKNGQLNFNEFKRFINRMQAYHKRCGKECNHLMRFYLRLGFVSMKYLNKRRLLKLGKPTVLPGFK